jgi:hypothetical protein
MPHQKKTELRSYSVFMVSEVTTGKILVSHTPGPGYNSAASRGASSHVFEAADLNLSRGFGPERSGPLSRALMLVLRRGDVHTKHDVTLIDRYMHHGGTGLPSLFRVLSFTFFDVQVF